MRGEALKAGLTPASPHPLAFEIVELAKNLKTQKHEESPQNKQQVFADPNDNMQGLSSYNGVHGPIIAAKHVLSRQSCLCNILCRWTGKEHSCLCNHMSLDWQSPLY